MWKEKTNTIILEDIGSRLKEKRIANNMTQEELAAYAGVSKLTIFNAEKGKLSSLLLFIRILRALDLLENLEYLIPDIPISPRILREMQGKKRKRVRKK